MSTKILVIDDDSNICEMLRVYLENEGYEVKTANDAQDLAIMRLELMNLIENNPDNTVEIEMLGKKYFNPPYNGDSYMSTIYSQWANARGLDTSFITH